MSLIEKGKDLIYKSFCSSLKDKNISSEDIPVIIEKGEYITDEMLKFEGDKIKTKFLMVGKVQSGKTINYISIIVNAIRKNIKFFLIFTSLDETLHNQTLDRLKKELDFNKNKNNLYFYTLKEINKNSLKLSEIIEHIENNRIVIITSLKNNAIKKFTEKIEDNEYLKKEKIFIIDDEGDAASMSHTEKSKSPTLISIENLTNSMNSFYLSVTATPQVHLISNSKIGLYPYRVFCVRPGKDYIGLDFFSENKNHFEILKEKNLKNEWCSSKEFHNALIYYIASVSKYLQENIFETSTHSNMLIHTNVKISDHKIYWEKLTSILNDYKSTMKLSHNDMAFQDFIDKIKEVNKKFCLNITVDKSFIKYLDYTMKSIMVAEINQNNNPNINQGFCKILIGSNLVGRGLTLDNLIVTFFTNRAKHITAIDTLLQRARWFGYRKNVINKIKIFTTEKIAQDFQEIANINERTWNILEEADKNKTPFKEIDSNIKILSDELKPTGKAPSKTIVIKTKTYLDVVNLIYENKSYTDKIIDLVKNSKEHFVASDANFSKYTFKSKTFNNFEDIFKIIQKDILIKLLDLDKFSFENIENQAKINNNKIEVVLLSDIDDPNKPRSRECCLDGNQYKLINPFQGRSINNNSEENYYIGDDNWYKLKSVANNKIFIQIHYIHPTFNKERLKDFNEIHVFILILPKNFVEGKTFTNNNLIGK